ncbi:hypothetical protein [Mesorhizobium sp. M1027]|uniref:IS66 family transposase n=1 Tax=Mesorhizobium sp. M1027 TaxID=2957050 RepID=UPI003339AD82
MGSGDSGALVGGQGLRGRRPTRKPFPEHLPRERVASPRNCPCCGSAKLAKLG